MNIGLHVRTYTIIAMANGYVMGFSPTEPNPYVTWKIDGFGTGVSLGHYFDDREEAEWDFCARAFEWFEDNMYIHMIEDGKESGKTRDNIDTPTSDEPLLSDKLLSGIRQIRGDLENAARLVDEMCAEEDRLRKERQEWKQR